MKIKFDTAIFGESNKAHSLLSSSDETFATSLTAITDLPIELPNTSGHLPMLSGFTHLGRFVFISSVRDKDASRNGMAKTTSLITDVSNVNAIHDLLQIFEQLDSSLPHYVSAAPLEIELRGEYESISSPGTVELVRALIATGGSRPVIWIGNDGFHDALAGLWRGLPPEIRRTFTFRFCCTPRDGRTKGTSLICAPTESRSRWKDELCIQPPFYDTPECPLERLFIEESTRRNVFSWAQELNAEVNSFEMFRLMADSQGIYDTLASASDLDVTILSRNLARLAPNPLKGKRIKTHVLAELESRISNGPLATIRYLRNILAAEFEDGYEVIRRATAIRIQKALNQNDDELLVLIREAIEDWERPWAAGAASAFRDAVTIQQPTAIAIFWKLITSSLTPKLQVRLVEISQDAAELERTLIKHFADSHVSEMEGRCIVDFCKPTDWAQLHAHVVSEIMSSEDALDRQLYFSDQAGLGISALSKCLTAREFVKVAVLHEQSARLLDQVVQECITDIEILGGFSAVNATWRAVVCKIAQKSKGAIDRSGVISDQVQSGWQYLMQNNILDYQYLNALSNSKFANILEVDNRSQIWGYIPDDLRQRFKTATAKAWFEQYMLDEQQRDRPEEPLAREILSPGYRTRLLPVNDANAIAKSIHAFNIFLELEPQDFDNWRVRLLTARYHLSTSDAQVIGIFIARRKWATCANGLLSDYVCYRRRDLHPALCECANLFGWLTQLRHSLSKVALTVEQWWDEVELVLVDLYPEGPRDKNVWERAGGYLSDLTTHLTGREQWSTILLRLRKGAELGVTAQSLIMACRNDYSMNPDLSLLIDNCPFRLEISKYDAFLD